MKKRFIQRKPEAYVSALLTGFMISSAETVFSAYRNKVVFTDIQFVEKVNGVRFFLLFLSISIIITAWMFINESDFPAYLGLFLSSVVFAFELSVIVSIESYKLTLHADVVFLVGISMIMFLIMKFLADGDKLRIRSLSQISSFSSWKNVYIIIGVEVILFTMLVSGFTLYRYYSFSSSTFDFGIFAQMFENMAKSGQPVTTLERGKEISHFSVHFSPTWYLLMPGYLIFRSPVYLYVINAFVIAIGAFPVYRICRQLHWTPFTALVFSNLYLLYPSMAAGTWNEIHENSLLPVLILYMVYFFLARKNIPMLVFAFLVLGDKEDAAIYIAAFALYVIFATKRKKTGILLFLIAGVYFVFATSMVKYFGGTVMTWRLGTYFPEGQEGFFGVVKTCVTDIGYLIKNVFLTENQIPENAQSAQQLFAQGKFQFLLFMLLPVVFLPFLAKKNSVLFLLIPMLVINLMPAWIYQYDIYFQYTYGTAALILVAVILAAENIAGNKKILLVGTSLVLCFLFSSSLFATKASAYRLMYRDNKEEYQKQSVELDNFLNKYYEEGDSVSANGYLTPHLSKVKELYTVPEIYGENKKTDWYVLLPSDNAQYNPEDILESYQCVNEGEKVKIYKKKVSP